MALPPSLVWAGALPSSRPWTFLAVALLGGVTILAVVRDGPGRNQIRAGENLDAEVSRGRELDAAAEVARLRVSLKGALARKVIQGRRPLLEVAALFRALNETVPPSSLEVFRRSTTGATDEERYCRHVIDWVRVELIDDPCLAEALVRRLETQLHSHLEHGLVLREVSAGELAWELAAAPVSFNPEASGSSGGG